MKGSDSISSSRRAQRASPKHHRTESLDDQPLLEKEEHNGFFNLLGAIAIGWITTHMTENYLSAGYLLDMRLAAWLTSGFWRMFAFWLAMVAYSFSIVVLQKLRGKIPERLRDFLYIAFQSAIYHLPVWYCHRIFPQMSPIMKGALALQTCVLSMKAHSFYSNYKGAWKDFNEYQASLGASKKDQKVIISDEPLKPPKAPTFREYLTFLILPTLVHEFHFTRAKKIRWSYALFQFSIAVFSFLVMYIMTQSIVHPILRQIHELGVARSIVRAIVPALIMWMIGFFGVFHCLLNGVAELTRFEPRNQFYHDWWNSTTMDDYWRKWNRTVYRWMCRHIYIESLQKIWGPQNKRIASFGVFVFTAVLHEFVFWNALGIIRPYMFGSIIAQVPLIYITRNPIFSKTRLGNLSMWFGFLFGMPLLSIMYAREWILLHGYDD